VGYRSTGIVDRNDVQVECGIIFNIIIHERTLIQMGCKCCVWSANLIFNRRLLEPLCSPSLLATCGDTLGNIMSAKAGTTVLVNQLFLDDT
jgi:hypothetical protein